IADAFARRVVIPLPSSQDSAFDLSTAYATESALVAMRRAGGARTAGVKVAFANEAVWCALKLETLIWARMYDDTVHYATNGRASLSIATFISPRIEPELVFRMARPVDRARVADGAPLDAGAILEHVDALAVGFEIIHTVYGTAKYQPTDFVAAYGHHAALLVGDPHSIGPSEIPGLIDALPRFTLRLLKDGALVAEGSGKNSLRSPALCLAELDRAMA